MVKMKVSFLLENHVCMAAPMEQKISSMSYAFTGISTSTSELTANMATH